MNSSQKCLFLILEANKTSQNPTFAFLLYEVCGPWPPPAQITSTKDWFAANMTSTFSPVKPDYPSAHGEPWVIMQELEKNFVEDDWLLGRMEGCPRCAVK